ncbi:hypothetical protein D3C84_175160 [compost metagenome]
MQVAHLRAVFRRTIETQLRDVLIRQRQMEAVTEGQQGSDIELFRLVRSHSRLAGGADAKAFLGLGQNHAWAALAGLGGGKGGVEFAQVVPAALEGVDFLSAHVLHQAPDVRVLLEEVLQVIRAVMGAEGLEFTIGGRRQALE